MRNAQTKCTYEKIMRHKSFIPLRNQTNQLTITVIKRKIFPLENQQNHMCILFPGAKDIPNVQTMCILLPGANTIPIVQTNMCVV